MNVQSVFFTLLRIEICGETISEDVRNACTLEMLEKIYFLASMHDLVHLLAGALESLSIPQHPIIDKYQLARKKAIFRYIKQDYAFLQMCACLENARIPFIPLKGTVLKEMYIEPWMRTNCDLDILICPEDVTRAVRVLEETLSYMQNGRATHDVSLLTPDGVHVELHFDLIEEGRANSANGVLSKVWKAAILRDGYSFWYELPDAWLYVYHIAHMAKHFEVGGCGIRPFMDLWLLENKVIGDPIQRRILLEKAGLFQFAQAAVKLSHVWFGCEAPDDLSQRLEQFILQGGTFGSVSNRVALNQQNRGGKLAYIISRVFIPYEKLKRYYPILEKYRWLAPFMQVRRWFMLLKPDIARMAKRELETNNSLTQQDAEAISQLLIALGIRKSSW